MRTLLLLLLAACNSGPPDFAGVGKWQFNKTTLGDVKEGLCQPTDIEAGTRKATWCFQVTPYKIAGRNAEIDLYFDGTEPNAPMIELQLKIRGCLEADLETWMRTNFGPPIENRPNRFYYKNSVLWAAALIPSEAGRCLVHFLPLSEQAEIARIKKK
jgi:hypothetical protein